MIYVSDIQKDVMGRLNLTRRSDVFSQDGFYRALNKALRRGNTIFHFLQKSETISGTGIFTLDTSVRPIHIQEPTWPSSWETKVTKKSIQEMQNIRRIIESSAYYPEAISTVQPSFWTYYPNSSSSGTGSPGAYIEVQDDSMITTAVDIIVRYTYLPIFDSRITSKEAELDVGEEYFDLLAAFTGREVCIRYDRELYRILDKEYQEEVFNLKTALRRRLQSGEVEFTEFYKW